MREVQTGSKSNMSVAQPVSINVPVMKPKPTEGMKVSVAELCGKFGEVRRDNCEKCAKLKSVRVESV